MSKQAQWTKIELNGSRWAGESPATIEELLEVLESEPLDPSFERYGNFVISNPQHCVYIGHGRYQDTGAIYPGEDVRRYFGNFARVSHVFNIDTTDPELIAKLTAAIRANQRTPAYRAIRAELRAAKAQQVAA